MKCPIDDSELKIAERSGVEIDYCPSCRGVWLDRGELDKILDRAEKERVSDSRYRDDDDDDDDSRNRNYDRKQFSDALPVNLPPQQHRYDEDDRSRRKKKSKTSFLSEMFEF